MREPLEYPFKTPPFGHQLDCWRRSKDREFFAFFMEFGAGKSKVFIDTAAYLYDKGEIDAVVLVAPKGVYRNWVENEVPRHMPDHIDRLVAWWDAEAKMREREQFEQLFSLAALRKLRFMAVNVEALSTKRGVQAVKKFLVGSAGCLMGVDESTTIKNPSAIRTKVIIKLGQMAKYRRILCGDPYANSPLDVYSQFEFLEPGSLGHDSFFTFRAVYANLAPIPGASKWARRVVGYKNLDALKKTVEPHAFTILKKDCLDLPKKLGGISSETGNLIIREVGMTERQRKIYEEMRDSGIARISKIIEETADRATEFTFDDLRAVPTGQPVGAAVMSTTDIVIAQLTRQRQIVSGYVRADGDGVSAGEEMDVTDGSNPRIADLFNLIEEIGDQKMIVWCAFRHNVRTVRDALQARYGDKSTVTYFGEDSPDQRSESLYRIQNDPAARFFVASETGSRGITVTAASVECFFSTWYDAEIRANAEDRTHRPGQTRNVTIVDQVCRGTTDESVLEILVGKRNISMALRTEGAWKRLLDPRQGKLFE